jgi:Mg-chelatase subunit ChlD
LTWLVIGVEVDGMRELLFSAIRRHSCRRLGGLALIFGLASLGLTAHGAQDSSERWDTFYDQTVRDLRRIDSPKQLAKEIRKFADQDYKESAEYLVKLLSDRRVANFPKVAAANVLGEYRDPAAREVVKKAATEERGGNLYALRAFIRHADSSSRDFLLQLAAKADTPRAQAMAIDGIREHGQTESLSAGFTEALVKWSADPETFHSIRLSAANLLGQMSTPEAITALVAQIDDPLLREVARDGLTRQTGLNYWNDGTAWKAWWKTNQAGYQPQPMKAAEFEALMTRRRAEEKDNLVEFFGVALSGKNILFVLDASGSMETDERMERLKDELSAMIFELEETYRFGLVLFPRSSTPGRDINVADDRQKQRAMKFIERMKPDGGTPMWAALEECFESIVPKENVDTIYLLSDGLPSDLPPEHLADRLLGYYELYGTVVHTLFIGDDAEGLKLMEEVAQLCGGRFAHIY